MNSDKGEELQCIPKHFSTDLSYQILQVMAGNERQFFERVAPGLLPENRSNPKFIHQFKRLPMTNEGGKL